MEDRRDIMKNLVKYLIISAVIVSIFIGLGYLTYTIFEKPFPSIKFEGGEIVSYIGIGYTVDQYYPEINLEDSVNYIKSRFSVSFILIIIDIILITAIQWVIAVIRKKAKQKA